MWLIDFGDCRPGTLAAEEKEMSNKLSLRPSDDGQSHHVYDELGRYVGAISHDHMMSYAADHLPARIKSPVKVGAPDRMSASTVQDSGRPPIALASGQGRYAVRLNNLIQETMQSKGCDEAQAAFLVVQTKDGQALCELKREEELAAYFSKKRQDNERMLLSNTRGS